ncbi:MAG TPA: DUF2254 domain-containing protein [Pyrinomonadaceae bacterium]
MNKLKQVWASLRASLWFVPGIMIFISIALALVLVEIDFRSGGVWLPDYPLVFGLGADGARGMLTAIAGSMLTVAALAFSLTLNAVSQASGQFTPRIFRNFMRDRANQFVLGYFVSVFAFCLLVLRTIRGADELRFVPSLAVMAGLLLALGGIVVLIFFIHHIAASLQITTILDNITNETKEAVERLLPHAVGEGPVAGMQREIWDTFEKNLWRKVLAERAGYVQNVDTDGLSEFASENGLLIKMCRGTGEYVGRGGVLAEVASSTSMRIVDADDVRSIRELFNLASHRTIEQDIGYGIRQIVDIALKALSSGVNDTTTAINCIDKLGDIVSEIACRRMPGSITSTDDVARVMIAAPGFADYVETAFDQIRISGRANQAVFERLLSTLSFIGECTRASDRRAILSKQAELIGEYAAETLSTAYERDRVARKLSEARRVLGGSTGSDAAILEGKVN